MALDRRWKDRDAGSLIEWVCRAMGTDVVRGRLAVDPDQLQGLRDGTAVPDDDVLHRLSLLIDLAKDAGLGEPPPPAKPETTVAAPTIQNVVENSPPSVSAAQPEGISTNRTAPTPRSSEPKLRPTPVSLPQPPVPAIRSSRPPIGQLARTPAKGDHTQLEQAWQFSSNAMCLLNIWVNLKRDMEILPLGWARHSRELAAALVWLTMCRWYRQDHGIRQVVGEPSSEEIRGLMERARQLRQRHPTWLEKVGHFFMGGGPEEVKALVTEAAGPQLTDYPLTLPLLASILAADQTEPDRPG